MLIRAAAPVVLLLIRMILSVALTLLAIFLMLGVVDLLLFAIRLLLVLMLIAVRLFVILTLLQHILLSLGVGLTVVVHALLDRPVKFGVFHFINRNQTKVILEF